MDEYDAYLRIVDSVNEAMLDDARWPDTSALIDEACGTRGSLLTFGEDRSVPRHSGIVIARSYFRGVDRSDWQREYFRDYYANDEHIPRLRALPDGQIAHVVDLFSEQELKTSRMYNEFLARFHGQNGLNVRLDGPRGSRIAWGIADPVDATGWSSSRIDMVGRVLPHLRQYVRVRTALVDADALGTTVAELLDNTRACVIQVDGNGRIVEASDRARELLRGNNGLSDFGGTLHAATPEDDAMLQDLLARALPPFGEPGASGSMMVRRPTLRPRLALHVKPVANRELEDRSRRVAALVLVVDPLERERIVPRVVQAALGLSPTEAAIAVRLAEGWTTRRIAAAMGREYSTVRTHLKHIFAKLGVSRQLEVAQLVAALSSLPAPPEVAGQRVATGSLPRQ